MLEVIDSFSRSKAESADLIRSASFTAQFTRQASSEISAWCDRDLIRQTENAHDSQDYLVESIRFVMRIGHNAKARCISFVQLVAAIQTKREQLMNDAQELREFDMLGTSDFQSIRELDLELLQVKQWATDEKSIYEQAVESLDALYARFTVVYPTRMGTSMMLS